MATNHVQQPDPNTNMFGDGGHEQFNYNNAIFSHAPVNNSNWAVDPTLQGRSQPFSPTPAAYPTQQSWQPAATPTPTSSTPAQHQHQYNASRGYFPAAGPNGPAPFQNTSPYAGYGLPQYQHQASLDPSLGGPTPTESRTFSQPMAMFSSTSPSNTISPSALAAGTMQGNRQAAPINQVHPGSPPNPSERKLSSGSQRMSPQAPQSIRPPSVNGYVQSQLPTQPKGSVSGRFILVDADELSRATRSVRLHNFVNIGSQQYDIPITKSTVPPYTPRKSQNELKALAAIDPSLKEKILKRVKKSKVVISKKQPKPVNGATRLAGSKDSPVSTSSASDSSDYDSDFSSDSDSEIAEPSPLPATRPQAALEAVRYDTIKAVWLPRNVYASADSIRAGLAEFWEVTKTIRDRWRTDSDAVKAATEANKIGELPLLKERVDKQRDMLQAALKAAIEHGHQDIMRLCGTIKPLMYVLYQFLVERIKANDYESDFTKTNLKFLSLCTGLNTEMAALTGLDKVFSRISKRGDAEGKALSAKITENAAAESKKAAADSPKVTETSKTSKAVDSKDGIKKEPKPVAGVKRPGSAAGVTSPAAKRVSSASSTSATAAGKGGLLKQPPSSSATGAASAASASKAKGHQVVTKPPVNFFSGLQSASKKPGTSLSSAKPKAAPSGQEKKAAAPAPVARSTFSFAETMANLTRVQEPESSKPEVKRPPETAEEKAKRLRKEERRKLRVTWKPDAVLVEVKLFSRDPSEMPSNATNVRDVRDGKEKEGLMFKQHMEMQDVDDDDDQPMEQSFFDFKVPSLIDFSHMESEVRTNNYEPYGGGEKKVDSPERLLQESREANTLMVHYMVKSDIPPCPREPADPYTGAHIETKMFGAPDDPKTLQRLSRFAPPPAAVPDVSALLANLHNLLPQAQPQAQVQPPPMDPNAALQNLLSNQFGLGAPQPAPLAAPPAQEQPAYDENSIEAILAKLSAPAQQTAQPQPPAPAPALQPYTSMDQNALLAALVNQTQQNPYMPANGTSAAPDGYDSQSDRKRGRDDHEGNQNGGKDGSKRQKWNNKPHSGPKFIYECRFYKKGECKKGADCTYRHEN